MTSFLGEIRRRKVFQVAAVYAVVAWLTIQIVDVVSEPLSLPGWLDTVVIILLAVGFPIAVILAWAFDLTPQGIKTDADVREGGAPAQAAGQRLNYITHGLVLLAVGFLVADQYLLNSDSGSGPMGAGQQVVRAGAGLGRPAHFQIALPEGTHLAVDTEHPTLALSPDGATLVYVAEENGTRRLYVRDLADPDVRLIPGSEGAASPYFSPDGRWIGFLADRSFKRVAASGGVPESIRRANSFDVGRGATWTVDDTVIFVSSANSGLAEFSTEDDADVATAAVALSPPSRPSAWPDALANGRDVLFTDNTAGRLEEAVVSVFSRDSGEVRSLVNGGSSARYSPTGHILFARGGSLYAAPFDASTTEVTGPELELIDGIITGANGAAQFAVAAGGTLAYVEGSTTVSEHEIVWVGRDGSAETLLDNGHRFSSPALSADGNLLALMSPTGPNLDIWVLDIERTSLTRWTTHTGEDFAPVWGPGGSLAFASEVGEDFGEPGPGLAWMSGPGQPPERLLETPGVGNFDSPTSWSRDGRWLLLSVARDRIGDDILLFDRETREAEPWLQTSFIENGARFSPDGRWVAYMSDQSGRREIYVRPFQAPGDTLQISNNGGEEVVWSPDGTELYYREGDRLMAVTLVEDATLTASRPQLLFEGRFERAIFDGESSNYDVSPDDGRFLMIRRKNPQTPTEIHVVLNWPEALRVSVR